MIVSIAVAWGVFVFLPGSVLWGVALRRAAFAMLPLIIAAFLVVDGGKRWRKYLRWLYAVLLAISGVLIWGGLSSIPYLVTAIIILWSEIKGCLPREGKKGVLTGSGLVLGLLGSFIWWFCFHNPLPGDKQLIEHFNAHRAEFEQLAQGYRNHRDRKTFYHPSTPEIVALMGKTGVNYIAEAGGGFGEWFPEPYSEHTLQVRKFLDIRSSGSEATVKEKMVTYRRELPALFEGVAPLGDGLDVARVTLPILFFLGPDPNQPLWGKTTLRYLDSYLNKGFCYYPQPPREENGHIIDADYSLRDKAYTRPGLRVFDSLDAYPPHWERGEYVLKRIDKHWFLFMCRVTP
jgi:hypothetical protein